jgi:hypothetical protein
MKCPHSPLNLLCDYVDTAGMDKSQECPKCPHYTLKASKKQSWWSLIQFVKWPDWHGFHFVKGNPLKEPAAFHLIYKWSLWLGWIEIRKFLTQDELIKAMAKFSLIAISQYLKEKYDVKDLSPCTSK